MRHDAARAARAFDTSEGVARDARVIAPQLGRVLARHARALEAIDDARAHEATGRPLHEDSSRRRKAHRARVAREVAPDDGELRTRARPQPADDVVTLSVGDTFVDVCSS